MWDYRILEIREGRCGATHMGVFLNFSLDLVYSFMPWYLSWALSFEYLEFVEFH
jgi:hypothetical protein